MIITLNYGDLQDIKEKWISERPTNKEQIYNYIQSYKDTLTNMYKNNTVKGYTREDYEIELMEFAKKIIANTDIPKKDLENKFIGKPFIINNQTIKLWLN